MPPRSVKMKRFIFGFQRRVWWPKWTPASSNSFMETTGMRAPFSVSIAVSGGPHVEAGVERAATVHERASHRVEGTWNWGIVAVQSLC